MRRRQRKAPVRMLGAGVVLPPDLSAPRRSKYGVRLDAAGKAARTVDGILFSSRAEAERYQTLVMLERAGEIRALECQFRIPIVVNGVRVATYVADFRYEDARTGVRTYEDAKGVRTPVYKLKARLVEALYGIRIVEV